MDGENLFKNIVHGYYPELYSNPRIYSSYIFYNDYVESYIEKDVSQLITLKNKVDFRRLMELLGSLTGNEIVYDNLAKNIGVDIKTVQYWISILVSGDIIYLLEPYNEYSMTKRVVKRPKIYFNDTGLAAYLARIESPETLKRSIFAGGFVETYIINEIRKTFINNREPASFYYYRDNNQNKIDLVILKDGTITRIEYKSGMNYKIKDISSFKCLGGSSYLLGSGGIICTTNIVYKLDNNNFVFPIAGI